MKNILKKTVSKKDFERIKNGEAIDIVYDITPYQCKKMRGFGLVCPYSLPFNETDRFCQKNGNICVSGKEVKFTECNIRLSKSDENIECDIIHMRGEYKDKPFFIITVIDKKQNNNLKNNE